MGLNNTLMTNTRKGSGFVCCCVLLAAFFLLTACGKKGDPTLKSYEKPETPSQLTAVFRPSEVILTWQFPRAKEDSNKRLLSHEIVIAALPFRKCSLG